jgi:UDP-N-acetylmuramyl tripeptide synthase
MRILSVQALRGANFWSTINTKLIQVRLEIDCDVYNDKKSLALLNKINFLTIDFQKEIEATKTTEELFAKICLCLQSSAHFRVEFFAVKKTIYPTIYNVVFEYAYEEAGISAAYAAQKIIQHLIQKKSLDYELEINQIKKIISEIKPNETISNLLHQAKQKNIPVLLPSNQNKLQFGYGKNGLELNNTIDVNSILSLFSENREWRIPIIAITGSNGKTTTTRLIAHIITLSNAKVGFTTSDGIYVDGKMIDEGDTTGPISAATVLRNKEVEFAVLETARGGIVRAGLGFDACDIAVVTNVQDDHLGISDIETLEDLAKVKGVVVNSVKKNGVAILNADNIYTKKLGEQANCKVSWFSLDKNNSVFKNKKYNGNAFAFINNNKIIVQKGEDRIIEIDLAYVPITFNGTLKFMTENVLAATLACYNYGIEIGIILNGLKSFFPSAEQTPGRMNIIEFKKCKVLIDFAHNIDGFIGIRDFLKSIDSKNKVGIIVGTGDRKDSDVIELGKISAQMFDHILIHQVKFLRGKTAIELIDLLVQGINSENSGTTWERVADDVEPLKYALSKAKEGSFICALSDVLDKPIELVSEYKKEF